MRRILLLILFVFSLLNLNAQSKNDLRLEIDRLKTDSIKLTALIANQAERIEGLEEYGSKLLSNKNHLIRDSLHMVQKIEAFESRLGTAAVEIQNLRELSSNLKLENDSLRAKNTRLSNELLKCYGLDNVNDTSVGSTEIELFIYKSDLYGGDNKWHEVEISPYSMHEAYYGDKFKVLLRGWGENKIRLQIKLGSSIILYDKWIQLEWGELRTIYDEESQVFCCIPCEYRDVECGDSYDNDITISYFHENNENEYYHVIRPSFNCSN